jgi:protein gp37
MGSQTGIEWTDKTWNPVRGCSRVSEGCRHCYAEKIAARFSGPGQPYHGLIRTGHPDDPAGRTGSDPRWNGEVRVVAEHLADPLKWRRPSRIFVNSMSDLFHERLTNEQIAAVFGVMAACPQHTFQILTKRARRMREWFAWLEESIEGPAEEWSGRECDVSIDDARAKERQLELADCAATELCDGSEDAQGSWLMRLTDAHEDAWARAGADGGTEWLLPWPLPNVWLGVSVENQAAADERIPELLATPAAVRFLSCEPLLSALYLTPYLAGIATRGTIASDGTLYERPHPPLDWVIAGCESGPGARPCDVAWLRSLRDQCASAAVPFFLKQARYVDGRRGTLSPISTMPYRADPTKDHASHRKVGGVISAPYLDGRQHLEFPGGPA